MQGTINTLKKVPLWKSPSFDPKLLTAGRLVLALKTTSLFRPRYVR